MNKPRIKKRGLVWHCSAPLRAGNGFGLTPSEAYRNWLVDAERPKLGGHWKPPPRAQWWEPPCVVTL